MRALRPRKPRKPRNEAAALRPRLPPRGALPFRARRPRIGAATGACLLVATLTMVLSVYRVSLAPPGLHQRDLEIAAASTTVLVDDPRSAVTDLAATTDTFGSLQARAALLGNLMTTDPVKVLIGRHAGIDPSLIAADAPITANVPQTQIEPGSGAAATDLLAAPDHYKLQMQVDPVAPILRIYAQAPSPGAAIALAGAAVTGLRDYLHRLDRARHLNPADDVRITQLGAPHGGVVDGGARYEIALLAFVTAFAIARFALLAGGRIRSGWRRAARPPLATGS